MTVGQWILRVVIVAAILSGSALLIPPFSVTMGPSACGIGGCTPYTGGSHSDPIVPCWAFSVNGVSDGNTMVGCVPEEFWNPLMAVFNINEYVPVLTALGIAVFDLSLRVAMAALWLAAWVWAKVAP